MVRHKILVILLIFCSAGAFAQEANSTSLELKPILHPESVFDFGGYQHPDGTKITQKEFTKLLKIVPDNEKIIKQGGASGVVAWTSFGLLVASQLTMGFNTDPDKPYYEVVNTTASVISAVSIITTIWATYIAATKTNRAIDNYNLYVMGFKVN